MNKNSVSKQVLIKLSSHRSLSIFLIVALSLFAVLISSVAFADDTTPPIITNVRSLQLDNNRVLIAWDTNEPSNSVVIYGIGIDRVSWSVMDNAMVTSHAVVLSQDLVDNTALKAGRTYYYEVQSFDASSNRARDTNNNNYYSFTVSGTGTPVTNTIGLKKYQSSWVTNSGRGNVFQVTNPSLVLREVKTYLNLASSQTLYFAIYKGASPTGTFYREPYEPIITNQGPGEGWYSSGTINWPLEQDYYYMIVTWWTGTAQYWADDFQQSTYTNLGIVRSGVYGSPLVSLPPETWYLDYTEQQLTYQQITTQVDTSVCRDECFPENYQYCSSSTQYISCKRDFDADPCLEYGPPQTCSTYCDSTTNSCASISQPNPHIETSASNSCAHFYASSAGNPYSGISISGSGSASFSGTTGSNGIFEQCGLNSGYVDWRAFNQGSQIQSGVLYVSPVAYTAYGYIHDLNNNPISGASLQLRTQCSILNGNVFFYPASTSSNGYFVASIPTGTTLQQVIASKQGFQTKLSNCGAAPKNDGNPFTMQLSPAPLEICSDNIDNDGNGKTDCADVVCKSASMCLQPRLIGEINFLDSNFNLNPTNFYTIKDDRVNFEADVTNVPPGSVANVYLHNGQDVFGPFGVYTVRNDDSSWHIESTSTEVGFPPIRDSLDPGAWSRNGGNWTLELRINNISVGTRGFIVDRWDSGIVDTLSHGLLLQNAEAVCFSAPTYSYMFNYPVVQIPDKFRLTPGQSTKVGITYFGYANPLKIVSIPPTIPPPKTFLYVWILNSTNEGAAKMDSNNVPGYPIIFDSGSIGESPGTRIAFYKIPVYASVIHDLATGVPILTGTYTADIQIPFSAPSSGNKGMVFSISSTRNLDYSSETNNAISALVTKIFLDEILSDKDLKVTSLWELVANVLGRSWTDENKKKQVLFVSKEPGDEVFCNPLGSPADLHLYDAAGNHVGLNSNNQLESKVPDSFYSYSKGGQENIVIFNPQSSYILKTLPEASGLIHIGVDRSSNGSISARNYEVSSENTTSTAIQLITDNSLLIDIDGDGVFEQTQMPKDEVLVETACFDNADNDADGMTDCNDSNCALQCNSPPIAFIQGPRKVLQNQPTIFDSALSKDFDGNITRFSWKLDNALISAEQKFSISLQPGKHTILLKVIDNKEASDAVQYDIDSLPVFIDSNKSGLVRVPLSSGYAKMLSSVIGEYLFLIANVKRGTDGQQYSLNSKVLDDRGNVVLSDAQGAWSSSTFFSNAGSPLQNSWSFSTTSNQQNNNPGEYQPDANTILLWHLNEADGATTAIDSSDIGNNGVISGTTVCIGKYSNCREFHNTDNDYISIGASAALNSNDATFETWVKPYSLGGTMLIVNKYGYNNVRGRQLAIDSNGVPYALAATPSTVYSAFGSQQIPLNQWTHLAAVFDESHGKIRLYINGQLASEQNLGSGTETGQSIIVGRFFEHNAFFNGSIDEVRISRKARAASELQPNQNSGQQQGQFQENQTYFAQLRLTNSTGDIIDVENYILKISPDADNDGIADDWEHAAGLNASTNDASTDNDSDGLSNYQEYQYFTNPLQEDSDGGGEKDGSEVQSNRNPFDAADDFNHPPSISPIGDKTMFENTRLVFKITASDPNDVNSISFTQTGLPEFCVMFDNNDASATVTCNANFNSAGIYNDITFTATDSRGAVTTQSITLTAENINRPPLLQAVSDRTMSENSVLEISLSANDMDGDSLSFSASNLPPFCLLNSLSGLVSCTTDFNSAQTHPSTLIAFTVSDTSDASDSKTMTLTINDVNRIPVLLPISNKTVNEGSSLNFSLNASDPDGDKLTYSSSNLPPFCSLNSNTSYVSCTPDFSSADNYPLTLVAFRASDGKAYDSKLLSLVVKDVIPCQSSIKKNTTLSSDLICSGVDGLYIDSNRIVIDCNGYSIKNSNSVQSGTGILVRSNSSSIKNCNITNFNYGIVLNKASRTAISNIAVTNSRYAGISLNSGTSNTLKNITSKSNQNGLQVNGGSSNAILNSIFDSNKKYGAFFNLTSSIKMTGSHLCTNVGKDVYVNGRTTTSGSVNNTCSTLYKWNDNKKNGCTYLC